jgi:hypothetical protein
VTIKQNFNPDHPYSCMADAETEPNIYQKRSDGAALHIHEKNRLELMRFYEALATSDAAETPPAMRKEDDSSVSIAIAEKAYAEALESLAGTVQSQNPDDTGLAVARLCLGKFVIGRVNKLRELARKQGTLGSFSLYSTMRDRLGSYFSSRFYMSSQSEMIGCWLDNEPLLSACSNLFGLAVPELQEILREFQPLVADDMARFDK